MKRKTKRITNIVKSFDISLYFADKFASNPKKLRHTYQIRSI